MLERLFKKCLISDSNIVIQILVLLVQCLVPFRNKKKITALIYHRVSNKPAEFDELSVPVEIFDWQMRLVAKLFNVISLDQALEFLEGGSVPSRAVVITFDDGYMDNYTIALPIIKKYGLCATFYVAGDAIITGKIWNEELTHAVLKTKKSQLHLPKIGIDMLPVASEKEKKAAINTLKALLKNQKNEIRDNYLSELVFEADSVASERYMMTEAQLQAMAQDPSVTIGCHSMSHPMLSYMSKDAARVDVQHCLDYLQALLQRPIVHFAYPYGKYGVDFHAEHVNCIADLPLKTAVTTEWGTIDSKSSFYLLRRFTPWNLNIFHFFIQLCKNYYR